MTRFREEQPALNRHADQVRNHRERREQVVEGHEQEHCLLYTSDAADD